MRKAIVAGIAAFVVACVCVTGALSGNRTDDPLGTAVSPQTLLLSSVQSGTVKVHTDIPLGAVDRETLTLNGIDATGSYADSLGNLVACFSEADVKAAVSPSSGVTLTLTGAYVDGGAFSGSDTVRVLE